METLWRADARFNRFGKGTVNGALQPPEDILQAARELPAEQLPEFIGRLESAKAIAWARVAAPVVLQIHDELLSAAEAARRLGISKDYLYRRASKYPFTRTQGRRLLFSAQGIDKYIRQGI
jgi:excisionase family DNA binding protein